MRDVLRAYLINQTAGALRTRAGTLLLITNALSHKSDPREKLRHGAALLFSATPASQSDKCTNSCQVLQTPRPIRSYRKEFLEGLRAYRGPLYTNLKFLIRLQLFHYNAVF